MDVKALEQALSEFEVKVVRHVRTPAGVRRFQQPIGAVIVRDGNPLKNIMAMDSEFHGWEKYQTHGGQNFYVGKERAGWIVTDPNDNDLSTHKTQEDALEWLDNYAAPKVTKNNSTRKPRAKAPKATSAPTGNSVADKLEGVARGDILYSGDLQGFNDSELDELDQGVRKQAQRYNTMRRRTPADENIRSTLNENVTRLRDEKTRRGNVAVANRSEGQAAQDRQAARDRANAKREQRRQQTPKVTNNAPTTPVAIKPPAKPASKPAPKASTSRPKPTSTAKAPKPPRLPKKAPTTTQVNEEALPYKRPTNLSTAKNARPGILTLESSGEGHWDEYTDGPKIRRYVGKGETGLWEVRDEKDNVLLSDTNKQRLIKTMNNEHSQFDDGSPVRKFPRRDTSGDTAIAVRRSTVQTNNLRHVESEQELRAHTQKYGYTIPRDARNVMINDNPDDPDSKLFAWYVQPPKNGGKAKSQIRQKPETADAGQQRKWERIQRFNKDIKSIDAAIRKADLARDDEMLLIALMREYGGRVGSDKSDRIKDDDEPRGLTELSAKEISYDPVSDSIHIEYAGKKYNAKTGAGWQVYDIQDAQIVEALLERMEGMRDGNARLFPDVYARDTMARIRDITGSDYTNHDLRRRFATDMALRIMEDENLAPRTKADAEAAMKMIDERVSKALNDRPGQALKSYIDPRVFADWEKMEK